MLRERLSQNFLMIFAIIAAMFFMVCAPQAAELSYARPVIAMSSAFNDTMIVSIAVGGRASELPSAYLFWAEDGAKFYVQRYMGSSLETYPFAIPASSSLIIPAPKAVLVDGKWEHHIWVNATTVTDTVWAMPLDR